MKQAITRREALALKARFKALEEAKLASLRRQTPSESIRALATLMEAALTLGWIDARDRRETEEVWDRWARLKLRSA